MIMTIPTIEVVFKCPHINCSEEYIGESSRTFVDRLKEHLRAPSHTHHHSHSTGHPVSPKSFTIDDRVLQGVTRNIKEAMYIHVNDPSLNRNLGKDQLPTHMEPSFIGHTCTPAQITQFYHPLHGSNPPKVYTQQILVHTHLQW